MNQQQVSINLPATHPVRAMSGIARSIALPAEFAPQRFPSFPALERTAVMGFTQPSSLTLPASTDVKMMLARQAAFPVWADQNLSGATQLTTYLTERASSSGANHVQVGAAPRYWTVTNATGVVASSGSYPTLAGATATFPINYAVFGVDSGTGSIPFSYVPDDYTLYFVAICNNGAVGNNVDVIVDYETWTSPGETKITSSAAFQVLAANSAAMSVGVAFTDGKWVRPISITLNAAASITSSTWSISVVATAGTAAFTPAAGVSTVTVTPVAVTAMLPLLVSSEFTNSQLPWYATRTTAAAVLGTNVTQILNKAGTVLGGRISPNVQDPWSVTRSYISGLHPAEKAWLPLETGVYTYCPPSTDLANFWDYTLNTSASASSCPVYRLDNDALVNILYVTAGAATESLAVTASWHIEFRTSSALFQVALSGMTLETFHQAQLSLAAAGFFFDNPDHRAILAKVVNAVNKVAPYAFGALQVAHPKAAALAKTAYNASAALVNHARSIPVKNGPMRMVATSGQRSGIVAKPRAKAAKGKGKKR